VDFEASEAIRDIETIKLLVQALLLATALTLLAILI